ncbi:MAG: DNA polymerase III subunit gamma/tau [Ignavibacteriales bacterium]|nr:DNA polymerase III subunit gamma/tau [Ignavibacteriales bacterium]
MSYQVTARKWRPLVFEDVVGQSHVTNTLRNAITSKRLAHAYLFSGARGTGKTTTARILAKAINCSSPKDTNPDNECEICKEITAGRSLDVIEIDGASNRGVEEIRNLRESVRYTPTRGKYKVYIIDEVHMLTKEAFNALLKTLEEPPEHVIFIFATTEVHKIPMTILSRCQRFDFRRISIEEITGNLRAIAKEEKVKIDEEALMIVAKKADGALRDAQSIFDQIRAFCGSEITAADVLKVLNAVDQELYFRVTDLIKTQDVKGGLELVDEVVKSGYDLREFLGGLSEHLRNVLVVLTTESTELVEASEPYRKRYQEEAKQFRQNDILRLIKLVNDLEQSIRWSPQPRFKLEAGLLQMIKLERSVQIDTLLGQIDELKKKLNSSGINNDSRGPGLRVAPASQPSTELKVVGQVNAGRLRNVSASVTTSAPLEEPQQPFSAQSTTITSVPLPSSPATPMQATEPPRMVEPMKRVTVEEAYEQWQQWVSDVRKTKIGIGTILGESNILDVTDGVLRIACPDDYHFSSLKRHKDFLVDSFYRVTGLKLRIEPVLHVPSEHNAATPAATVRLEISTLPPTHQTHTPGGGSGSEHPVILALRRELGAEPIE